MKTGRPSLTAVYVAFARAVASNDLELSRACQDDVAELLLPAPLDALIARIKGAQHSQALLRALRLSALGMCEHQALRTRLIDDAINQGIRAGARQLVILGAGLDSRAHRLAQLAELVVFEVDHPSSQAFKRERARALPVLAGELRYVACDFEQVTLSAALHAERFDAQLPSIWIWEGVTMYLTPSLTAATVDIIAAASASGSKLVATYLTPMSALERLVGALPLAMLGALSEPVRGQFSPAEMSALLRERGLLPVSDTRTRDVAARYAIRFPPLPLAAPEERIVVADKRSAPT